MAELNERRKRFYVDKQVQGALLRQLIGYWLVGLATLVAVVLIYRIAPHWLSGSNQLTAMLQRDLGPLVIVSLAISPVVIISAVRFSNRFVGPMLRFRRALRQLAEGKTPAHIVLRKQDYWCDIAEDINTIAVAFAKASSQGDAGPTGDSTDDDQREQQASANMPPLSIEPTVAQPVPSPGNP